MARPALPEGTPAKRVELFGIPAPGSVLRLTLMELPKGQVLHRVHQDKYSAVQFNPGTQGNARFSPIQDEMGRPIPTLYGGTSRDCALMETVFHDVPYAAGFKSYDKKKLLGQRHSTVELSAPLSLVDLASVPLRKLGLTRKQLIDTEKDQYPATRLWAAAIYQQCAQAQGLCWISRQDDSARAVMLFGDRIAKTTLRSQGASLSLSDDSATYDAVLDLAERIGVLIVPGCL
ncbi:RES family NAD+ phosphorylase [Alcaligenes nematophilus]|uniref:RES family NAD+ phosphorylase n=1 Tax=Alcaligenes nematophilus TaxID=2994643 RepID=UPI0034E075A3